MADILPTAQGTLAGDIEQIKEARFGRDVRASIAEALELIGGTGGMIEKITTTVTEQENKFTDILRNNTTGWISVGGLYPIYQWLDGTTSLDKVNADPSLKGTDVTINGDIYTYSSYDGTPGALVFKEHQTSSTPSGFSNKYGHPLACGYSYKGGTGERLRLYNTDEELIQPDTDGDLEQCAILYDQNYGVKGFKTDKNTKVYIQDLLNRIAALEAKVK